MAPIALRNGRRWNASTSTSNRFLDRIDHPDFKRKNTLLMARRILGRTRLTTREVTTIHGILRRAEWHMEEEDPEEQKGEE